MSLKTYKPTTPSQRQLINIDRSDLWSGNPFKPLTKGITKSGGRNNHGHITSWNRGGGHKRRYRLIDFKRENQGVSGVVERLEYDPNRSSFIALIKHETGKYSYILASQKLKVGDSVSSGENADIKPGNALPLREIPVGTIIHNIEIKPGKGGQLVRAAGTYAQIVGRDTGYVILKLASGESRKIRSECYASIGAVSNPDHQNRNYGKAGRNRWLGWKPCVRGVAMNPIDHPHGGGEGRTSGGRHPCTPWGIATKGKKTRSNKRTTQYIIRKRSK